MSMSFTPKSKIQRIIFKTIYYRIVIAKTCYFEHTQNNINATTTCMYLLGRPLYRPEFCTPLSQMTSRSRWIVIRNFSGLSGRALGKAREVPIGWIVCNTTCTCDQMNLIGRDVFKVTPTQQNFENERKDRQKNEFTWDYTEIDKDYRSLSQNKPLFLSFK